MDHPQVIDLSSDEDDPPSSSVNINHQGNARTALPGGVSIKREAVQMQEVEGISLHAQPSHQKASLVAITKVPVSAQGAALLPPQDKCQLELEVATARLLAPGSKFNPMDVDSLLPDDDVTAMQKSYAGTGGQVPMDTQSEGDLSIEKVIAIQRAQDMARLAPQATQGIGDSLGLSSTEIESISKVIAGQQDLHEDDSSNSYYSDEEAAGKDKTIATSTQDPPKQTRSTPRVASEPVTKTAEQAKPDDVHSSTSKKTKETQSRGQGRSRGRGSRGRSRGRGRIARKRYHEDSDSESSDFGDKIPYNSAGYKKRVSDVGGMPAGKTTESTRARGIGKARRSRRIIDSGRVPQSAQSDHLTQEVSPPFESGAPKGRGVTVGRARRSRTGRLGPSLRSTAPVMNSASKMAHEEAAPPASHPDSASDFVQKEVESQLSTPVHGRGQRERRRGCGRGTVSPQVDKEMPVLEKMTNISGEMSDAERTAQIDNKVKNLVGLLHKRFSGKSKTHLTSPSSSSTSSSSSSVHHSAVSTTVQTSPAPPVQNASLQVVPPVGQQSHHMKEPQQIQRVAPQSQVVAAESTTKVDLSSVSVEDLLDELRKRRTIHRCICGIMFENDTMYFLHRGVHHSVDPRTCNLCDRKFSTWFDFHSHFFIHK